MRRRRGLIWTLCDERKGGAVIGSERLATWLCLVASDCAQADFADRMARANRTVVTDKKTAAGSDERGKDHFRIHLLRNRRR